MREVLSASVLADSSSGATDALSGSWKTPRNVVLVLIAAAELVMLWFWGRWLVFLPAMGILTLIVSVRRRPGLFGGTILFLIGGGAAIFLLAPISGFIAFAYPAVFGAILVTARPLRLFSSLVTLIVVSCIGTFFLDAFQQEISYGNKKVITVASMWASGEPKHAILTEVIAQFENKYPEYKVVVRWDGRAAVQKSRPRLLTGKDVPDIIEGGKEDLRILIREGYALPFDPYLEALSAETGRPWKEDWLPGMLDTGRYGVGVGEDNPLSRKVGMASNVVATYLWFYNKALARQLGLDMPLETWDDFRAACEKAKAAGYRPIMLDSAYKEEMIGTFLQVHLPEGEERKTILGLPGFKPFTDPCYVRIYQLERELADKYIMEGWQGSQWPKAQQNFATGKGLFILCGSWLPGELRVVAVKDKSIFELGAMPLPRFQDEPAGTFALYNFGWVLLKDGRETEGAVKLLQYLTDNWGKRIALEIGDQSAFARDPLPEDLSDIKTQMKNIRRVASDWSPSYAPNWYQYIFMQLHADFFQAEPGDENYISAEEFCRRLEEATKEYRNSGGEERWR